MFWKNIIFIGIMIIVYIYCFAFYKIDRTSVFVFGWDRITKSSFDISTWVLDIWKCFLIWFTFLIICNII